MLELRHCNGNGKEEKIWRTFVGNSEVTQNEFHVHAEERLPRILA